MNPSSKESSRVFSLRELSYMALMVAACVTGRLLFQGIPNVQPMTAIFLIITVQLGASRGMLINLLSVVVTNIYLGMGPWTISQLISFSGIIGLFALLRKAERFRRSLLLQVAAGFLAGFVYGLIISVIDAQLYGIPAFIPYYMQSLPFDFLHAVGNAGFYLVLAPVLNKLFVRLL